MIIKNINNQELINELKKRGDIGKGYYGLVNKYDDNTLIKIYYKDIYNTFFTYNNNILEEEVKTIKNIYQKYNIDRFNKIKILYNKLNKTHSNIIKGIVLYNNFTIGVLLDYYQNYYSLHKIFNDFTIQEKIIILDKIKYLLEELNNNNIYLTDLNGNNILINYELEVKLIDIDDFGVRIESDDYIRMHPNIKDDEYIYLKSLRKGI